MKCVLSKNEPQAKIVISNSDKILKIFVIEILKEKKICIIPVEIIIYIHLVLTTLFSELDARFIIYVAVNLYDKDFLSIVDKLAEKGFNSPHISDINPLKKPIQLSLVLCRQNIPADPNISEMTLKKVMYALQQYKLQLTGCKLFAKLSKNALYFLKESTKQGFTTNGDGKKTQKELSGELYVKTINEKKGKLVYIIDINRDSVRSGEEESVSVAPTRYNFHSHPREAYIRHSVDNAWPSLTDYIGYFKLGNNTIFHCIASIEGLYILSFGEYWGSKLSELSEKVILKNYDIESEDDYTPTQYVERVNAILYKNHPIFNVKYFPWKKADSIFEISFAKTRKSCLSSQQIMEKYKKLYK